MVHAWNAFPAGRRDHAAPAVGAPPGLVQEVSRVPGFSAVPDMNERPSRYRPYWAGFIF